LRHRSGSDSGIVIGVRFPAITVPFLIASFSSSAVRNRTRRFATFCPGWRFVGSFIHRRDAIAPGFSLALDSIPFFAVVLLMSKSIGTNRAMPVHSRGFTVQSPPSPFVNSAACCRIQFAECWLSSSNTIPPFWSLFVDFTSKAPGSISPSLSADCFADSIAMLALAIHCCSESTVGRIGGVEGSSVSGRTQSIRIWESMIRRLSSCGGLAGSDKGQKPGPVELTGGSLNTTTVGGNGGSEPIDSELIMGVGMTRKRGAVVQLNQQCSIQGGVEAVLLYIVVK
jgi:hypothetical protein